MKRENYGNYTLYYEDTFALYVFREHENAADPEKIMETVGHGFTELFYDAYSGHKHYHTYRPRVTERGVEIEYIFIGQWGPVSYPIQMKMRPLGCISSASSIKEVYGERGIKCGNRRLRKLFGRFIEIENRAPIFARFEGTYMDYLVKGINLGHTYSPNGLRYLMYSDGIYFGSTTSPRLTHRTMKIYEEKYRGEEIIGYIDDRDHTVKTTVKIRRQYDDHTIDVIVSSPLTYPLLTQNGIEFRELTPEKYDLAFKNTEKFIEALGLNVTKVKVLYGAVVFQSDVGKVIVTPYSINIAGGPTVSNTPDNIPYLIVGLHYPSQTID